MIESPKKLAKNPCLRHPQSREHLGLKVDARKKTIMKYILEYVLNSSSQMKFKSMGRFLFKSMIQIWSSLKMRQIIKHAFMKIFDLLVKIAIFGAFLLFLCDSCHKLRPKIELDGYIISSIIQPPRLIFGRNL